MTLWRVTIERANGTFYVRDVDAETSFGATSATLAAYRAKYADEPVDGFTHWVKRCVRVERSGDVEGGAGVRSKVGRCVRCGAYIAAPVCWRCGVPA